MKKLLLLALLLPLGLLAQNKGDRAWIVNPSKIQRAYTFTAEDDGELKKAYGKEFKDKAPFVKVYSKPDKWPRSISATKGFNDNADTIKKYIAYYVCTLPSNKTVLHVPAKDNEDFTENFKPKTDIYFVIQTEAVVYIEPEEKK